MTEDEMQEEYIEFMLDIRDKGGEDEESLHNVFTEYWCDYLTQRKDYVAELTPICYSGQYKSGDICIDAYYYDEESKDLTLLISSFCNNDDLTTLNAPEVKVLFSKIQRFYLASKKQDFLNDLYEQGQMEIYNVVGELIQKTVANVRFILVTNKTLGKGVSDKTLKGLVEKFAFDSTYTIWDFNRYCNEILIEPEIEVDCTTYIKTGLRFLPEAFVNTDDDIEKGYKTYLLMIPGRYLYEWYKEYADRLLQQNVRSFLQCKGKVNKGIRTTIKFAPNKFLAYNNGITAIATSIELDETSTYIKKIKNLQIVNGGQTTVSLYTAVDKGDASVLNPISVQMKLVLLENDKKGMVQDISRYANSQNPMKADDLDSNHPFFLRMEEFSRRMSVDVGNTVVGGIRWFFERSRGQYLNSMITLHSKAALRHFKGQNPKSNLLTKMDIARYSLMWDLMPWKAVQGGDAMFKEFKKLKFGSPSFIPAREGYNGWKDKDEDDNPQFCEFYYKELIAKAILYKTLDASFAKCSFCKGFKVTAIVYSIALLRVIIAKRSDGKVLDLEKIWKIQKVPSEIQAYLTSLAQEISDYVKNNACRYGSNISNGPRLEEYWNQIKIEFGERDIKPNIISEYCSPIALIDSNRKESQEKQKEENDDFYFKIVNDTNDETWKEIAKFIKEREVEITTSQKSVINQVTNPNWRAMPKKRAKILVQLWKKLIKEYDFPIQMIGEEKV